jgi:hypothetical protein
MSANYGKRGRVQEIEPGVRTIAPTFGRARLQTHSLKSGHIVVDGQAERLVSHLLEIDPSITHFLPQPFSVDLVEQRILRTREQLSQARRNQTRHSGPLLYTPDFCITWASHRKTVLEVKTEGYEGDAVYVSKLGVSKAILERHGYEFATIVVPRRDNSALAFNLQLLRQSRLHRATLLAKDISCLDDLAPQELTLGSACAALGCSINHAAILVATGVLSMDVARHHMHTDTLCQRAYGDLSHLSVLGGLLQ